MKKIWILTVSMVILLAVVGLTGCSQGDGLLSAEASGIRVNLSSQQEGIWVNGSGKVMVVPDVATLSLGIEAQNDGVALAQSQAAEAMDKVKASLTGNGVAEKDIQTRYFSIQRITRWDQDKQQEIVIGYRVTNMVIAKIRELDKVGTVIDAVAVAGGDLTRIDNIGFSVEDPSAYYEEAREKAMTDAKNKAQQMAELAEVKLGKPSYISESVQYPQPVYRQDYYYAEAATAPAVETSINPGEMELSINVQVAYSILAD
ncbi:SIMPL domain-containing protein [Chloroflexota bacterium]